MSLHGLKGPVSKTYLLDQAARVRRKILSSSSPNGTFDTFRKQHLSSKTLFYPSSYEKRTGRRGFSNWLLKDKIMIGQYPGQTPEMDGPSLSCAKDHIDYLVVQSNIRLFCCLQSEIPAQDDYSAWSNLKGQAYFQNEYERKEFPNFFGHYAPLVQQSFKKFNNENSRFQTDNPPSFLHTPIRDLSIPSSSHQLYETLSFLLETLECKPDSAIYIHCWGGRGRAGLVGACLLSVLFPHLSAPEILEWVQRGYDTRFGAEAMPLGLKESPQTSTQKDFVRKFVEEIHKEDSY